MLNIKGEISELCGLKAYNGKRGKTADPMFLSPVKSVKSGIDIAPRSPVLSPCFSSSLSSSQERKEMEQKVSL